MLFQCYSGIVILSSSLLLIQQGFHFMIYDLNPIIIVMLMIYAATDMKMNHLYNFRQFVKNENIFKNHFQIKRCLKSH